MCLFKHVQLASHIHEGCQKCPCQDVEGTVLSKLIFTKKDLEARSEELGDGHGHPSESIVLVLRVRAILKVAPFQKGQIHNTC